MVGRNRKTGESWPSNYGVIMRVSFDLDCPPNVSDEELVAYLNFELQIICSIQNSNPLSDVDIGDLNTRNLKVEA